MRKAILGFFLGVSAVFIVAAGGTESFPLLKPQARPETPALQIITSVVPVARGPYQLLTRPVPGTYRCSAVVQELESGKAVMATNELILAAGETKEESAVRDDLILHFRARIAKAGDRADTAVTITRDGKVMSRQTSTVWLERTPDGPQPLR